MQKCLLFHTQSFHSSKGVLQRVRRGRSQENCQEQIRVLHPHKRFQNKVEQRDVLPLSNVDKYTSFFLLLFF